MHRIRYGMALAAALCMALPAVAARADDVADFYRGRNVTLVGSAGAGGGVGLYVQLLAEHMGKHIPGNPTIVPNFMPGAGGVKAANFLYSAAPKDGTYMGMILSPTLTAPDLQGVQVKFDRRKINWIGGVTPMHTVIAVWHTAPATTIEGLKTTEVVMGATGRGGGSYTIPKMMNTLMGTKFKIVTGYAGMAEITLAMERGEVHSRGGSWQDIKANRPDWVRDGKLKILVQLGTKRHPELKDVPLLTEVATTPEARAVFHYNSLDVPIGRAVSAPQGVPEERVKALRAAFNATMKDPTFLADARSKKADVDPVDAAELKELVDNLLDTPPEVVKAARSAMGFDEKS